jgi:hypothetical protein
MLIEWICPCIVVVVLEIVMEEDLAGSPRADWDAPHWGKRGWLRGPFCLDLGPMHGLNVLQVHSIAAGPGSRCMVPCRKLCHTAQHLHLAILLVEVDSTCSYLIA